MSTLEAFSLPIQSITNIDFGRRRLTTGPAYMDGRLDETVIYKRLLNADERGWLYNNGNGRAYADLSSGTTYTYNTSHKHAVASLSTGETYSYDANGNTPALHQTQCGARVTQRVEGGQTYTQTFDAENRLISVTVSGQTTQFIYNGDGNLIKKINPNNLNNSRTLYVGGIYEVDKASGGSVTRTVTYYPVAGAMRINSTLYYVMKDHLGSASVVTDASGVEVGEQRYYPFGETRLTTGTIYTDKLYTGQREMAGLGIYHYQARFYSPKLGRFLSADNITPNAANPQNFNRYSYVTNNPLRYTDPSGHIPIDCYNDPSYCSNTTTLPGAPGNSGGDGGGGGGDDVDLDIEEPDGVIPEAALNQLGIHCGVNVQPLACEVYTNTNSFFYTATADYANSAVGNALARISCTLLGQGCIYDGSEYLFDSRLSYSTIGRINWNRYVINPLLDTTEPLFRASWGLNSVGNAEAEIFPMGSSQYTATVVLKPSAVEGAIEWNSQSITVGNVAVGSQPHIRFTTQQTGSNSVVSIGSLSMGRNRLGTITITGVRFYSP